jgi:RND family efflux transporter MFP subunit
LAAVGYIVAERQAAVSSKATGRLKELRVREGDSIAAGEVVGTLENDDLQAALAGAEAQHGVALAQLEARRAERSDAMTAAARAVRLYADKTLSVEAHDAAQLKVRVAQAAEAAAEAAVSVAAAAAQRASAELEYTIIKAPFAGTVISKNAELGEIVAPFGSSASARAALVTIADLSSLLVEADISESAIMRVGIGTLCDIRLDASPDKVHHGAVVRIVPTVDRAKATVLTKIQLSLLTPDMLPEMSAKITCFPGKSLPTAQ